MKVAGDSLGSDESSMHDAQWDEGLTSIRLWNFSFSWQIPLGKLKKIEFHKNVSELLFLEIFSGSGNLSASVKDCGIAVYAVDNKTHRHGQVAIHALDLTKQSDIAVLLDLTCYANIASAHLAPPCGTSSRARERPLPQSLMHIKAEPLRSTERPLGLEGLSGLDAIRVGAANKLYALTVVVFLILHVRGAAVSVENPSNSHFWAAVLSLLTEHSWLRDLWGLMEDNAFQSCMYGSDRDKWTTIKATKGLYTAICKQCDGSHSHRSWVPEKSETGVVFPTSQETAYPRKLCDTMASCLSQFLQQKGVRFPEANLTEQTQLTSRNLRQFGKRLLPPLMSEYWLVADETSAKHFQDSKPINKAPPISENGGKCEMINGSESKEWYINIENNYASLPSTLVLKHKETNKEMNWHGVFRNPKQAVEAASKIVHPLDNHLPIPDPLIEAVFEVLNRGPTAISNQRVDQCKRILKLVAELKDDEEKLHSTMQPEVAKVLKGKRLLVWKKLLVESGYEDSQVVDEAIAGFPLVGASTVSDAFPRGATPAQQSVDELKRQAVWRRRSTIGKCGPTGDDQTDAEAWRQTLEEASEGWLSGPYYSESQVSSLLKTEDWICTRRFPLQQPGKIRLIDDGLDSGLNSAFSSFNKLQLMDMDSVVTLVNIIMQSVLKGDRLMNFKLSCGKRLEGKVHPAWHSKLSLLGRTLDLTAAYKQLAVDPSIGFVRALVTFDPESKRKAFFIMNSLPFGATSSVYAFNRVAKSLWFLMVRLGAVWTTQYFDDFPNIEMEVLASSSRGFMEFLLNAVGWRFAGTGKKAPPYAPIFKVLGVEVNLTEVDIGKLVIQNKPDRVGQIKQFICDVMDRGRMTSAEAATLHGQLNFAQGQYYGCVLKPGMAFLQQILKDGWKAELQQSLGLVMAFIAASLMGSPPRVIKVSDEQVPILLFTDGAYEPNDMDMIGSAGLVLIDRVSNFKIVQAVVVPDSLHQHWKRGGSKQLIALMELWPIVVAMHSYGGRMQNRRCLSFIDNNAVRDGLIKGSSPLCDMFSLLSVVSLDIAAFSVSMWFTRIPSKSNPADDPSRGRSSVMANLLGAEELSDLSPSHELVSGLQSNDSFITYMQQRSKSLMQPAAS